MGFLKSLFGESSEGVPLMQGNDYSIIDLYLNRGLVSERVIHESEFPWTNEKQIKFLEEFRNEKFVFDGEVKCIVIDYFWVDRDLRGEIAFSLYKETKEEYVSYAQSWGENTLSIGKVFLTRFSRPTSCKPKKLTYEDVMREDTLGSLNRSAATGKNLSVNVIKHHAPEGQSWHWINRS